MKVVAFILKVSSIFFAILGFITPIEFFSTARKEDMPQILSSAQEIVEKYQRIPLHGVEEFSVNEPDYTIEFSKKSAVGYEFEVNFLNPKKRTIRFPAFIKEDSLEIGSDYPSYESDQSITIGFILVEITMFFLCGLCLYGAIWGQDKKMKKKFTHHF